MRTRNIKINIFLNEEEKTLLQEKSVKNKLSQSSFIRNLIHEYSEYRMSNEEATNIAILLQDISKNLLILSQQLEFLHYSDYVNFLNRQIDNISEIIDNIKKIV